MSVFTDESGAAIPEAEVADKLAKGEAFADNDADYAFRDRTGKVVQVKGSDVGAAMGGGLQLLSREQADFEARRQELESGGNTVRTMLERGASVASGGLTDLAAGLASPELAKDMRERATAQPGAAAIGEFGGAIVPFSLAGKLAKPVSALARAVKPTTAAGRMALRAAATTAPYALEGAFYGASSAAGAAALQGDEITAEKVLSGAGKGALLGGLLGGGTALLAARKAAPRLARGEAIAETTAREGAGKIAGKLDDFAADQAISALRPSKRLVKEQVGRGKNVDEFIREAGRDYLGYEMKTGELAGKRIFHAARDPVDVLDDVTHAWNETGRTIGKFRDMADEAGRADPSLRPSTRALNDDLDAIVRAKTTSPWAPKAELDLAEKVEREYLEPIRRWRQQADDFERAATTAAPDPVTGAAPQPPPNLEIRDIEAIRKTVDQAQRAAKRTGNLAEADLLGRINKRMVEHTDEALENTLGAQGVDLAPYKEAKRVYRSLTFVKKAIDEMAFSKAVGTKTGNVDPASVGYALSMMLMGHPIAAAGVAAAQVGQKLIRERAGGIVAELAHRAATTDARIGLGARALAGGISMRGVASELRDRGVSGVVRYTMNERPQVVFERLREVASSPERLQTFAARQTAPVAAQHPELAMAMQTLVMGDLKHLAETAPAGFQQASASMSPLTDAARQRLYSQPAVRAWMQRAAVLEDPGALVDALLEGDVPMQAIETLELRRPHVFRELREQVQLAVAESPKPLPFKRRITLGTAFKFPADYSMQPAVAAELQAPPAAAQAQAPGKMQIEAQPMLTTTQRLEDF